MKIFILLLFLFSSSVLLGQSAFEIKYSKDVCNCLDSINNTEKLSQLNFENCFLKGIMDDSISLLQECFKIYGDTSYESGYKFGQDLIERTTINLVGQCKTYFIFVDSLRYEDYKNLNQDSLKLELEKLNNTEISKSNDEFYSNKALIFFEMKLYDSSLINIENALNLNSNNFQSLYLKAWINEIKGNFDVAIKLYDKVAELTQMKGYYIFSAVAKRKKNSR